MTSISGANALKVWAITNKPNHRGKMTAMHSILAMNDPISRPKSAACSWKSTSLSELHITKREREILTLICDGKSAQEIAMILGCSVHTVRTHIESLKDTFSVYKDTALVAAAIRKGVIE